METKTEKFNLGKRNPVNFNVIIAGRPCCGKSTLLQSFALPYTKGNEPSAGRFLLGDSQDCSIHLEERTAANPSKLRDNLLDKHNAFIVAGCKLMTTQEELALDTRIHCLIYMFGPHRVLQSDRDCLKAVAGIVPVVPVLAKADSLTTAERQKCLQEISELMVELDRGCDASVHYDFVGHDQSPPAVIPPNFAMQAANGDHDRQTKTSSNLQNVFALVCSAEASGLRVYPWGPAVTGDSVSVSAYDERVSDFRRLQRLVFERGNIARLRDLTQRMTIALHQRRQQEGLKRKRELLAEQEHRKRVRSEGWCRDEYWAYVLDAEYGYSLDDTMYSPYRGSDRGSNSGSDRGCIIGDENEESLGDFEVESDQWAVKSRGSSVAEQRENYPLSVSMNRIDSASGIDSGSGGVSSSDYHSNSNNDSHDDCNSDGSSSSSRDSSSHGGDYGHDDHDRSDGISDSSSEGSHDGGGGNSKSTALHGLNVCPWCICKHNMITYLDNVESRATLRRITESDGSTPVMRRSTRPILG